MRQLAQKVCICWRPSNHACWWLLAGSGKVLTKDMATAGEYLQTWKLKLSTTKTVSAAFILNNKEAKCELKVKYNNETMPFLLRAQIPRSNIGPVAHVSSTPWATSQEANITRRTHEAACWLWLGCWSNNSASHPSPGPFNRRALRSCLVPLCSNPPHWPCHQRLLANCDWMPASYTSGQPSYSCRLQVSNILSFVANELHFL